MHRLRPKIRSVPTQEPRIGSAFDGRDHGLQSSVRITNELMGGPPWRAIASLENFSGAPLGEPKFLQILGHIKNIHLHSCKHKKTVTLKLTLTLTLTLTDTGGAVLTLMLGCRRLRIYKLKRKIQN